MKPIIAPSILSLDYSKMNEQMESVNNSKATWLHFDVMDGHFVPNLTFGPDILKGFVKLSNLVMDVHLMVDDPLYFIPVFAKAGANHITFHYESYKDKSKIKECIDLIHSLGLSAGLSIKPDTDVNVIQPYINGLDLVLLMSVYPGFGGQSFIEESVNRAQMIHLMMNEFGKQDMYLQIDGGINLTTIEKAAKAGCNNFVAGSAVFKGSIATNIDQLWNKAASI